jgi:hypothetical protein
MKLIELVIEGKFMKHSFIDRKLVTFIWIHGELVNLSG